MRRRRYRKQPIQKKESGDQFLKPTVQRKLKMGKAGDKYEVEADQMADKVVNNPKTEGGAIQKKDTSTGSAQEEEVQQKPLASTITPLVQKQAASEEENAQAKLQRKEEEEAVQAKGEEEEVQKKGDEEEVQAKEEEEVQKKGEEEEGVQAKEEEEVQKKGDEEEVQAKEDEEAQAKEDEEAQAKEEEEVQKKSNPNASQGPSVESRLRHGNGGQQMDKATKAEMESGFGADFSGVRIHTDSEAAEMSQGIGAQAFTHGNDIYFNKGKYNPNSKEGKHLLAHELTHTIQQNKNNVDENVQLREATWLERRAWLSFFSHYIPRKFLNNYMDDTGTKITLTQQEMKDCNPIVSLTRSANIRSEIARLQQQGGGTANINTTGWGGARTNGSLGNFTIHYKGTLTVKQDGTWAFQGTMYFTDYWDFDPKAFGTSGRSTAGELKTRVAAYLLPGAPFHIDSDTVKVSQTSSQSSASWGNNFVPVSVGDNAGRTALDIEIGAAGGGVGGELAGGAKGGHLGADLGAVGGSDLGGELGAQSSEDLN